MDIPVAGTDGMQFTPDLSEEDVIGAFVNDISRIAFFTYEDKNTAYKGLDTMMFQLQDSMMLNMTANPANEVFDVYVDGTTNLTTTLKAAAFASKGHFYQISPEVSSSVPKIVNLANVTILPSASVDETYLGVEKLSGVNLIAQERL